MTVDPAPTSRRRLYPWDQHARYLRDHPNQWVLIEARLSAGTIHHVRSGRQPHMAKLNPHLELRLRNQHTDPESGAPRWELWARYLPNVIVGALKPEPYGDDVVREIRQRFASGADTLTELSEEFGLKLHTIRGWINGRTRKAAGGPITGQTNRNAK